MLTLWKKKWVSAAAMSVVMVALASTSHALTFSWSVEDSSGVIGAGLTTSSSSLHETVDFALFLNTPLSGTDDAFGLNFNAVNNSPLAQTFSLSLVRTTAPTSLDGGSIAASGALTLSDTSSARDGASLTSVAGEAVFQATLDGLPAETLFDAPYQLSCSSGSLLACNTVDSETTGPSTISTLGTTTARGIVYQFELSPGDSAAGNGTISIQAVPEPSLGLLVILGGTWLASRRRRKQLA